MDDDSPVVKLADSLEDHEMDTEPASILVGPSTASMFKAEDFECVVCYDSITSNHLTRLSTISCDHLPNMCQLCLVQHITSSIDGKMWDQVDCPSCNERLDYQDIMALADAKPSARQGRKHLHLFNHDLILRY